MGRLTTLLAASATHPDSLPDKLPKISLIDAILPSFIAGDPRKKSSSTIRTSNPQQNSSAIAGVERNGKDGKLQMVRPHRSKPTSMNVEVGSDKDYTNNDLKKKNNGKGKDKEDGKKNESGGRNENNKKNEAAGKTTNREGIEGKIFTKKDDAKIIANKEVNGLTWQQNADDVGGTSKAEVTARYRELTENAGGPITTGDAKNGNDKSNNAKKGEGQKNGGDNSKPFTAEEDAKIKELMGQNMNAAKIALEMKDRTVKEIGVRIGELKRQNNEADGDKKGEGQDKSDDKQKGGAKGDNAKGKEKKGGNNNNNQGGKGKPAGSVAQSEVKFTMSEWITLQEDDEFTFRELQFLSELIGKYPDWSWLQIASRFADKMGRRVHPEDIREKFLQMAAAA